ncbi:MULTISPECIES: hypothetical protein [unclassified Psychrobacter]|uniref:hypothetical protein n=1 Tax=unclassified Psychrobacter TaxID=196806 RepID=UPI00117AB3E2|nr:MULTISPECIES: hypothetical protein [unclassified Psychrobacter]
MFSEIMCCQLKLETVSPTEGSADLNLFCLLLSSQLLMRFVRVRISAHKRTIISATPSYVCYRPYKLINRLNP